MEFGNRQQSNDTIRKKNRYIFIHSIFNRCVRPVKLGKTIFTKIDLENPVKPDQTR